MGAKHLLNDIAHAAQSAAAGTDVGADGLDFVSCIGRTTGEAAGLHHFIVGDVVAHIEHLVGLKARLVKPTLETVYLDRHAHKDVLQAKADIACAHRLAAPAGDDGQVEAAFHGQLHGIAVFDVGRAGRLALLRQQVDVVGAQHAVDVEGHGFDFGEVVVNHGIEMRVPGEALVVGFVR